MKISFGGPPSEKGLLVVSSFYSALVCNDGIIFSWKSLWWAKVLLRAAFLLGRQP